MHPESDFHRQKGNGSPEALYAKKQNQAGMIPLQAAKSARPAGDFFPAKKGRRVKTNEWGRV
ncbi:MAG: hypothetical protein C6P37_01200 [Caldibacillus debilis]|nr:MAG: hypothetical protein C6P37_01200 [Caldibacillus debilis]